MGEASIKEEVNKTFFYKSKEGERSRFRKAYVGVSRKSSFAFGVSQSLMEERTFTVIATPLGPNLCLL